MKKFLTMLLVVGLVLAIQAPCFADDFIKEIGKEIVKEQIKRQTKATLKKAMSDQKSNLKSQSSKMKNAAKEGKSFYNSLRSDNRRKPEEKKSLVVGFGPACPPYSFVADDGSYDGFDFACAKELCRRLGWEFTALPIDWNSKDSELKAGTVDCIWSGFTINGREDDYEWSAPYVENKMVIVLRSDSPCRRLEDLQDRKLAVLDGSSAQETINSQENLKNSLKKLVIAVNYDVAFDYLAEGTVDAVAVDIAVANNFVKRTKGKFKIMPECLSVEKFAIAFLKGNTTLRNIVNTELVKMAYDGTIKKIAADYVKYGLILDGICIGRGSGDR